MVLAMLINHPERLNRDTLYELRSIVARYPYFQTARLLMLNNMYLLHEPDFGAELRRSVLYVYDRRTLCRLIEGHFDRVEPEEDAPIEEPSVDRTMSLIDAFLGTLPENSEALQLPVDVVGDYAARFLLDDEVGVGGESEPENLSLAELGESAMELSATPVAEPENNENLVAEEREGDVEIGELKNAEETLDESYFTETLAKIYIKQHKYSRALEIIRSLYLKYPEKNIYFADQIRFLEKLIINNNSK